MLHAWKHFWNTGMAAKRVFRGFHLEMRIISTLKKFTTRFFSLSPLPRINQTIPHIENRRQIP
jgi:hypothetical protein